MCRACYNHLKDLRRISKFLSVETAALLQTLWSAVDLTTAIPYFMVK